MRTVVVFLFILFNVSAADWVTLLPGADFKGWTRIPIPPISGVNPKLQWSVAGDQIVCKGDGGHEWLRYDQPFTNYELHAEWRFAPRPDSPKYNSGIGIVLSPAGELWVQAQTGATGGYLFGVNLVDGAFDRFNLQKQMKENRVKPAGEWNTYDIRVQGGKVTLSVNGEVVNEIAGMALRKGYIGLEAEGFEIAFRNLKIRTLD